MKYKNTMFFTSNIVDAGRCVSWVICCPRVTRPRLIHLPGSDVAEDLFINADGMNGADNMNS